MGALGECCRVQRLQYLLSPVGMIPGAYELTVILCSASSNADNDSLVSINILQGGGVNLPALCVNPRTANFDAQ